MTGDRRRARSVMALAGLLAVLLLPGSAAAEPKELWRVTGLKEPESVLYDPERDVLYVSNVNGAVTEKDGNGYIAKLSPDGRIEEAQWVTGLDAPKGMALVGDRLYVSDIDRLVAIDIADGKIVDAYPAAGAKFLNDVTADRSGRVFVSDMMTDTIHVLEPDGRFEPWMQDAALMSPNGLLAEADRLVVAAWGVTGANGETETPGRLETVDYETKTIHGFGEGGGEGGPPSNLTGNLDGVEGMDDGGYLVTDWVAGALFRVRPSGETEQLLDLDQGSADLEYRADENLALIPIMGDGAVVAYRID